MVAPVDSLIFDIAAPTVGPAVVPVLVGPLQALIALAPAILAALGAVLVSMFKPSAIKQLFKVLWSQKIMVLAIVGLIVGAVYLKPILLPTKGTATSQANIGEAEWPLFRGGAGRRGAALDAEDPVSGDVVWSHSDGEIKTFYSSPTVVGNRVYATSARYEYFKDVGSILCVDADTGDLVWKYSSGKYRATFSSPAVKGKHLVVGEGLHLTRDARVFCIDVEASEKKGVGVKLWDYRTKSHVESSPCILEDRVIIGAGDDGLYCFALEPNADGSAKMLWHLEGEKYPDCETSPVVHEGKVYFGLGIGGQALVCADVKDGKEEWRIDTPYPAFGSPTIAGGKLFFAMGTGNFIQSAEEVVATIKKDMLLEGKSDAEVAEAIKGMGPAGEVWCVDIATGKKVWDYRLERTVLGCVAAVDGRIYFGSRDKHVYCLTEDGKLVKRFNARSPIVTSPAVAKEHVYTVTDSGMVLGLTRDGLEPAWKVNLNSASMSSPAVARGHVYVGTNANGLICAGTPGKVKEAAIWRGRLGGPGGCGRADRSLVSARASFAWRWPEPPEDDDAEPEPFTIDAPLAALDGSIYAGVNYKKRGGLVRLDLGGKAGGKPTQKWFCPSKNDVLLSAAGMKDRVYFVDGKPGDEGRRLRCVNVADGRELYSRDVAKDAGGQMLLAPRALYVADVAGGLTALQTVPPAGGQDDGAAALVAMPVGATALWTRDVGTVVGTPLLMGDILVVATDEPAALAALDAPTGRTLWTAGLDEAPVSGPVQSGGWIWLPVADEAKPFDPVSGGPAFELVEVAAPEVEEGEEPAEPEFEKKAFAPIKCPGAKTIVVDGDILAATGTSGIVIIDPFEIKELYRIDGADSDTSPFMSSGAVLYYDGKDLQRHDAVTAKRKRWMRISWMGKLMSPVIAAESHVYFVTDKRGITCAKPKK